MSPIKLVQRRISLILLLLLLLPHIAVAQAVPDIRVTNVEVTQATQTPTNTITLIAQRSTAVRATIGVTGSALPVNNVTGRLHVFVNGVAITPTAGLAPINAPLTAPITPQRANENDTLNFELPAPSGILASTNVDFRVDLTPLAGETNTTNNTGEVLNLTFVNRTTPSLFFTRINWTPSRLGLPNLMDIQPGRGDAFVRGIYPVNDADPNLYRQGLFPTLTFMGDANGNGILNMSPEGSDLLSLLASCRQLIVDAGLGAANNTFLYGWIAGNPLEGNGLGQVGGRNAYGNTDLTRYQRTYAHELGHNFGIGPHNSRNLDQVGWDVGGRLTNNPVGNNTSGRVKPITLFDIMAAGRVTNEAWVDTVSYNFFLNNLILTNSPDAENDIEKPSERVLVIQGIFDPSGRELLRLEPTYRFPWLSQPTSQQFEVERSLRYIVEVVDENGVVYQQPFDALLGDDGPDETRGFFEVMVAVPPEVEISTLRILDTVTQESYGGFERSEPPQISIVSPQEGSELGEETEVAWDVQDADTPIEDLMYMVAYSPDGGSSWVPIGVDIPGDRRGIVFNSTEIQKSDGNGVLRVFVSDGLNTAFADVTSLTPTAAQYPGPDSDTPTSGGLSIAFPISQTELRLVFSDPLDLKSAETITNYTSSQGLEIMRARLDENDPRKVTLTTSVMDGRALIIDRIEASNLQLASGETLPTVSSPEFLQGIASIEGVRTAYEAESPYASRFINIVASMSCGKNGGVNGPKLNDIFGFTFLHEERGGPFSSIKVVVDLLEKIPDIESYHDTIEPNQTIHLLWAGGVIQENNGETQLVDTGYMEGFVLDPLITPPPYPVKIAEIGGVEAAQTETAKSLEGVIILVEGVTIETIGEPDERGVRAFTLVDDSGGSIEALFLPFVTMDLQEGQRLASVRALVHRSEPDKLQLLIEWDGDLKLEQ